MDVPNVTMEVIIMNEEIFPEPYLPCFHVCIYLEYS